MRKILKIVETTTIELLAVIGVIAILWLIVNYNIAIITIDRTIIFETTKNN